MQEWEPLKKLVFKACTFCYKLCINQLQALETGFFCPHLILNFACMKDLRVDENGDLLFENGDFKISESDTQHQKSILLACKGDFKEFPELGIGIEQLLADDQYNDVLIEAKKNLEYDGMLINNILINENGILKIDGKYKSS